MSEKETNPIENVQSWARSIARLMVGRENPQEFARRQQYYQTIYFALTDFWTDLTRYVDELGEAQAPVGDGSPLQEYFDKLRATTAKVYARLKPGELLEATGSFESILLNISKQLHRNFAPSSPYQREIQYQMELFFDRITKLRGRAEEAGEVPFDPKGIAVQIISQDAASLIHHLLKEELQNNIPASEVGGMIREELGKEIEGQLNPKVRLGISFGIAQKLSSRFASALSAQIRASIGPEILLQANPAWDNLLSMQILQAFIDPMQGILSEMGEAGIPRELFEMEWEDLSPGQIDAIAQVTLKKIPESSLAEMSQEELAYFTEWEAKRLHLSLRVAYNRLAEGRRALEEGDDPALKVRTMSELHTLLHSMVAADFEREIFQILVQVCHRYLSFSVIDAPHETSRYLVSWFLLGLRLSLRKNYELLLPDYIDKLFDGTREFVRKSLGLDPSRDVYNSLVEIVARHRPKYKLLDEQSFGDVIQSYWDKMAFSNEASPLGLALNEEILPGSEEGSEIPLGDASFNPENEIPLDPPPDDDPLQNQDLFIIQQNTADLVMGLEEAIRQLFADRSKLMTELLPFSVYNGLEVEWETPLKQYLEWFVGDASQAFKKNAVAFQAKMTKQVGAANQFAEIGEIFEKLDFFGKTIPGFLRIRALVDARDSALAYEEKLKEFLGENVKLYPNDYTEVETVVGLILGQLKGLIETLVSGKTQEVYSLNPFKVVELVSKEFHGLLESIQQPPAEILSGFVSYWNEYFNLRLLMVEQNEEISSNLTLAVDALKEQFVGDLELEMINQFRKQLPGLKIKVDFDSKIAYDLGTFEGVVAEFEREITDVLKRRNLRRR